MRRSAHTPGGGAPQVPCGGVLLEDHAASIKSSISESIGQLSLTTYASKDRPRRCGVRNGPGVLDQ